MSGEKPSEQVDLETVLLQSERAKLQQQYDDLKEAAQAVAFASYEAYCADPAHSKPEDEWDEYDHALNPSWRRLLEVLRRS